MSDEKSEIQTASEILEPLNDDKWKVCWWNESMRLMLPDGRYVDSVTHYDNGTVQLVIKSRPAVASAEGCFKETRQS